MSGPHAFALIFCVLAVAYIVGFYGGRSTAPRKGRGWRL